MPGAVAVAGATPIAKPTGDGAVVGVVGAATFVATDDAGVACDVAAAVGGVWAAAGMVVPAGAGGRAAAGAGADAANGAGAGTDAAAGACEGCDTLGFVPSTWISALHERHFNVATRPFTRFSQISSGMAKEELQALQRTE
jgi:hypothetical protein